jgi:hypothetical protein
MDNELKTVKNTLPPYLFFVRSILGMALFGGVAGSLGGFCAVLYVEVSIVSC